MSAGFSGFLARFAELLLVAFVFLVDAQAGERHD